MGQVHTGGGGGGGKICDTPRGHRNMGYSLSHLAHIPGFGKYLSLLQTFGSGHWEQRMYLTPSLIPGLLYRANGQLSEHPFPFSPSHK